MNKKLITLKLKTKKMVLSITNILYLLAFLSTIFLIVISILGVTKVIPFFQVNSSKIFQIVYLIIVLFFYGLLGFISVCDLIAGISLPHVKESSDLTSILSSMKKAKGNMLFITAIIPIIIVLGVVGDWRLLIAGNIWIILYLVASCLIAIAYLTNWIITNNNIKAIETKLQLIARTESEYENNIHAQ